MGYLNEHGLARYDGLIKNWVTFKSGTVDGVDPLLNWQKTDTAGAVACYPLPAAPIDPVVNFLFTETGPASGTKGPDNPSTITGVSEVKVTRCGKNLCPLIGESSSSYISVSFTDNGEFVFNGSYIGTADVYVFNKTYDINSFPDYLERGKTYTFSLQGDNSSVLFQTYKYYNGGYGGAVVSIASGESQTYTIPDTQSMILRFSIPANTVLNNAKFKLQIEEGSTATSFEPYAGTDYTVNLGDTYYGGSVDLSTGVMTVTHNGIVLTGVEQTSFATLRDGGIFEVQYNIFPSGIRYGSNQVCSHLIFDSNYNRTFEHFYMADKLYLWIDCQTKSEYLAWLTNQNNAGTPVTIVYPLATPYTVQLTPTQIYSLSQSDPYTPRINTVYSDQVSVQVGYPKSPLATSTELTNAIVSLGGNI